MIKYSEENDVLHSDADGSYDISFFASSVGHTLDLSRAVFGKLSGKRYSELASVWRSSAQEEKKAFLLENHESAHHGLLFSTPAGVLLWRLNQVLSRDVHYIARTVREAELQIPFDRSPRKWLTSQEFRNKAVNSRLKGEANYLFYVIDKVEKLLTFRQLVFERSGAALNGEATLGEFVDLANEIYPYLGDRCGLVVRARWTTKRSLSARLFPDSAKFNVMDIAEVHAVAKELFLLRAMRDLDGFSARAVEFEKGRFGDCFRLAREMTKTANEVGFNPHAIQISALLSLSTSIDLPQCEAGEIIVEDHLPWMAFSGSGSITGTSLKRAIASLLSQLTKPTIGAGSLWLVYKPISESEAHSIEDEQQVQIQNLLQTLTSAALESQIFLIHRGAEQNIKFLSEVVKHQGVPLPQKALDDWEYFLSMNKAFVEYDDGVWLSEIAFEDIYKENHPARLIPGFLRLRWPHMHVLSQLLNGAITRRSIAMYSRYIIPKPDVINAKIRRLLDEEYSSLPEDGKKAFGQFAQVVVTEILGKGRDLPFGPSHLREMNRSRYL